MLALSITTAVAAVLACAFALLLLLKRSTRVQIDPETTAKLIALEAALKDIPRAAREDAQALREELRASLLGQQQALEARLGTFGDAQIQQMSAMRTEASDGRAKLEEALKASSEAFSNTQTTRLGETNQAMKDLAERLGKDQKAAREEQKMGLDAVAVKIQALIEANDKKQDAIREALTTNLDQLRKDNEAKLEQMRVTVDEKLQGTLETRLGESFKLVSDRLELVHKGLGEMQTLATGVGDLKRVLSNVKSRGGWGEIQLGALLGDMLTPDQFETNVHILPGSSEVVEFAVRLPGKFDDTPVYLPIDAKFPHEDYDRLAIAQESGVSEEVDKAAMALERTVQIQAKLISEKYIHPPHSTDFAIMYLPTEGLFAEVIRRPGLCAELQSKYRVMVTGPTTLAAMLNSLQMGFRTLAIEKRSSEVWQVLSAAKAEFAKYGDVWDKLSKQLQTAQNTVSEAGRRTRAVERKLRDVETVELPPGVDVLGALPDIDAADDEAGEGA